MSKISKYFFVALKSIGFLWLMMCVGLHLYIYGLWELPTPIEFFMNALFVLPGFLLFNWADHRLEKSKNNTLENNNKI